MGDNAGTPRWARCTHRVLPTKRDAGTWETHQKGSPRTQMPGRGHGPRMRVSLEAGKGPEMGVLAASRAERGSTCAAPRQSLGSCGMTAPGNLCRQPDATAEETEDQDGGARKQQKQERNPPWLRPAASWPVRFPVRFPRGLEPAPAETLGVGVRVEGACPGGLCGLCRPRQTQSCPSHLSCHGEGL